MLVCYVLLGMRVCITGTQMTYLPDALQVPLSSLIPGAVVPMVAGLSASDGGGAEPPSKRARPWSFLPASTWYMCGAEFHGMSFPLPAFWILGFEGSIGLNGRSRTLLSPVIHRQLAVLVEMAMEVPGAGGTPWSIVGTDMSSASIPRNATPGGIASTPESSGVMRPELLRLYLPGSFDFASSPINWRRVESNAKLACSQVTTAER
jgi:hypothetical protein